MKKILVFLLLIAALAGAAAVTAAENTAEPEDEWTVLFYLCGSDLESKYSYATGNLKEINKVILSEPIYNLFLHEGKAEDEPIPTRVNVLIETGGSSRWHAQEVGMDIRTDALQRWRFDCQVDENGGSASRFQLMETLPLASMADPGTLADFIRWGARTFPAKKYALVLWDHGGGALTGLFIDELFNNDVMYLYQLKQALADGGITFEALIFDACMMANIETASVVRDYARWMVGSEEEVPGQGTAIQSWLSDLYAYPECDGKQLGRFICDMTMIKYANIENEKARSTLTWSVIDLSKIERLNELMSRFFRELGKNMENGSFFAPAVAKLLLKAEEYGDGQQDMRDITSLLYQDNSRYFIPAELRNEMLEALAETVVYSVRGTGRTQALGLSFCYPTDCSPNELDVYAKNYPNPDYLAFLDAVTEWNAPEEVYDTAERIQEFNSLAAYQVTGTRSMTQDGVPGLLVEFSGGLSDVYYRMYRLDETTGQVVRMGRTACVYDMSQTGTTLYYANEPWQWPAIDETPCDMELVMEQYRTSEKEKLFNIPVQIGTEVYFLRCGQIDPYASETAGNRRYEVYGVWEGYNQTSQMTNRSVTDLSKLAGQEYRVIWPLHISGGIVDTRYLPSGQAKRLFRTLDVAEITLPAGTYYLEYEIDDIFQRPYVMERIEFYWDGEKIRLSEKTPWEGPFKVQWRGGRRK